MKEVQRQNYGEVREKVVFKKKMKKSQAVKSLRKQGK